MTDTPYRSGRAIIAFIASAIPFTATAQGLTFPEGPAGSMPGASGIPPLGQLFDVGLFTLYAFDALVALAITSAIAFHPARMRTRRGVADLQVPRIFFLFALIGMAIGFLVLHYGALIGFVVFGIGGLLRFRTILRNSVDTVEVILVTLLGLCVGLNLQTVAVLVGATAWALIWVFGRKKTFELRLSHTDPDAFDGVLERLDALMNQVGWMVEHQKRLGSHSNTTSAKAAATVVFSSPRSEELTEIESVLAGVFDDHRIEWRVK